MKSKTEESYCTRWHTGEQYTAPEEQGKTLCSPRSYRPKFTLTSRQITQVSLWSPASTSIYPRPGTKRQCADVFKDAMNIRCHGFISKSSQNPTGPPSLSGCLRMFCGLLAYLLPARISLVQNVNCHLTGPTKLGRVCVSLPA